MNVKDFQKLLKQKKFDTEYWMEQMKYGGADPMLEFGIRQEPYAQTMPYLLNPSAWQGNAAVTIMPTTAIKAFGKNICHRS